MTSTTSDRGAGRDVRIVEIRPGEGGDDAKLFAMDLAAAYRRLANGMA